MECALYHSVSQLRRFQRMLLLVVWPRHEQQDVAGDALAGRLRRPVHVVNLSSPAMSDEALRQLMNSAGAGAVLLLKGRGREARGRRRHRRPPHVLWWVTEAIKWFALVDVDRSPMQQLARCWDVVRACSGKNIIWEDYIGHIGGLKTAAPKYGRPKGVLHARTDDRRGGCCCLRTRTIPPPGDVPMQFAQLLLLRTHTIPPPGDVPCNCSG